MNLRDLPAGELPRERLIARGAEALSDAELLAILLRTGRAGENVLELARGIVARFRETGLHEILAMPCAEFARIPGIGTAKAATVLAALELGRRAQQTAKSRPRIREASDVAELLRPRFRAEKREHFLVLPLSAKNEVLMVADVSVGTLTNALVHPREVFEPPIRCGAAHIILAHNHPSGDPAPSAEDHRLTRVLKDAGALLGIPVTDHVIIGGDGFFSFAEEGVL
ncbi:MULTISPECIES: DNA repair protein RadC [unclassified Selenomonas]|uniref:RadC family protein n=1 Tax=unclassified Selenomonas TaxID=2637378 RepID=UPI000277F5A1|nr:MULTISPECIES: DNA repair protein RadC [unclassified Selenomonas]EJO20039.1 RadC-like JAB domain protein [Selenomonas sp. FOBRC6]EKX97407.1 DNA repair protein RadC [Selenomonas sp. oral taxon 138 str. F0429]